MEQFLLTDAMIHNSFEKTGIDMKYFAVYEAEAKRCFQSLQGDCPDDEATTEDDNNALRNTLRRHKGRKTQRSSQRRI